MNKVILKVVKGKLLGKEYAFDDRTTCLIGRALDCNILLPDDQEHSTISRYHCLLDINPPEICIRDFGSLNGTYVNGEKIGQREQRQSAEQAKQMSFPEYNLRHGDQIELGDTVFRAIIHEAQPSPAQSKQVPPPHGNPTCRQSRY